MSDWAEFGKEVLSLALRPRYSFVLWVSALILLTVPLPDFLRLDAIPEKYGETIGLLGLVTFILWVVELTLFIGSKSLGWWDTRKKEREILEQHESLSPWEARFLVMAVDSGSRTLIIRPDLGEIGSLISKGLLERVPDDSRMPSKPFTVPMLVWKHINKRKVADRLRERAKPLLD